MTQNTVADVTQRPLFSLSIQLSLSQSHTHTHTHTHEYCWCGMFSRCIGAGLLYPAPSGHTGERGALLACTSVINNCCSGPASGQTDLAVFSTALPVVSLRNYLRFNSLLCNTNRKKKQSRTEAHAAQEQHRLFRI